MSASKDDLECDTSVTSGASIVAGGDVAGAGVGIEPAVSTMARL